MPSMHACLNTGGRADSSNAALIILILLNYTAGHMVCAYEVKLHYIFD